MNARFPLLFSPLAVGPLQLRNRIVMGPMHTGLESVDGGAQRLAAFYAERAHGGVALIVTGGFAPNAAGAVIEGRGRFDTAESASAHRCITQAVHREGASVLLQILHAGGYARHAHAVAASAVATPFCPVVPRALDEDGIQQVIEDHVQCARLARSAGYDGVDLLGAGGYLLNGFFSPRTNRRHDRWGGSLENRARLATSIVARIRAAAGPGFAIGFRLSLLDLVESGSTMAEAIALGQALARAGVDFLGTAFGWHESRVPTIGSLVPPAAFASLAEHLRAAVAVPVMTSNRINDPRQAEALMAQGATDLIALARPLLADAQFANKSAAGRAADINVCLACNQGCLDHTFEDEVITCVVNPRVCRESEWAVRPAARPMEIAVIGAGPAGLACAAVAAERGLRVTVFDARRHAGGQFALAGRVPGKDDYRRTISHYLRQVRRHGGRVVLGHAPLTEELRRFEHIVVATGVVPKFADFEGLEHPQVITYEELLEGKREAGRDVILVGAGPIAFDVAELLLDTADDRAAYFAEWGIHPGGDVSGGLGARAAAHPGHRRVWMLQRRSGKPGRSLGRTTGWARRVHLERLGLRILTGCQVHRVGAAGTTVETDADGRFTIASDTVILCVGQEPSGIPLAWSRLGRPVTVIGGARDAQGLDAGRAILEGWQVACNL